jgi:hypothetical protein
MATGTVSRLWLRFSAVTTISAIELSSLGAAAGAAAAGAGAGAGVGSGAGAGSAKAPSENATDTALESNSATVLVIIFNPPQRLIDRLSTKNPAPTRSQPQPPVVTNPSDATPSLQPFQMVVPPHFGALNSSKSHRGTHYSIT